MLSFTNDYSEGAHELILRRLAETNMEQLPGYCGDKYCLSAAEKIRSYFSCPKGQVYFLNGGTQTNMVVISSVLRSHEGVIAADSGHISAHEAGAIEFTGHKVLTLPGKEGKLCSADVQRFIESFYADRNYSHMVFPGMVYISQPTEYGTLYSHSELAQLSRVCRRYNLPLYMDGARLGYALASDGFDLSPADIADYCDIFYIGGTKVGALCGEALVFPRGNAPGHFLTSVKQHGALFAKGRLPGVQFDTMFTDDLYYKLGRRGIEAANTLRDAFEKKGYKFFIKNTTNQIFIVLTDEQIAYFDGKVEFGYWESLGDGRSVVRFATSWATSPQAVAELISLL